MFPFSHATYASGSSFIFWTLPGYSGFAHFSKDRPSSPWAQVVGARPFGPKDSATVANLRSLLVENVQQKLRNIHIDDIDTCKHNEIFKGSRWIIYPTISDLGWSSAQAPFAARSHKEHDEGEEAWWNQTMGKLARECWKHILVSYLSRFGRLQLLWLGEPMMIHVSTEMGDPNVLIHYTVIA